MNDVHKIAVLGKDVYILYMVEMAHYSRFLLVRHERTLNIKCA